MTWLDSVTLSVKPMAPGLTQPHPVTVSNVQYDELKTLKLTTVKIAKHFRLTLTTNVRTTLLYIYVIEGSGRCCRHSALHSGKWETTAGSVQQQQDFILQTKPAQMQQTHTAKHIVSAGCKESKQTEQLNCSSKQPNQQNLCFLGLLQLQISLQLHNQLSQTRHQIKA